MTAVRILGDIAAAALVAWWVVSWLSPLWGKATLRERLLAWGRHTLAGAAHFARFAVVMFAVVLVFCLAYGYALHH